MHPILAIRAFFALLFGAKLPPDVIAAGLLPEPSPEAMPEAPKPVEPEAEPEPEKAPEPKAPAKPAGPAPEAVAVQALAIFQSEGRLLDFLSEDIEAYDDADIGAAVREVHRGCKKALADHFDLEPVREEEEEALVSVPEGYDPAAVRLVGNVVGSPPFSGTLKHKGWRAKSVRLPKVGEGDSALVIAPAEVEI
ncbi:MAG: DUF2760 domain-containing protein [Deltaproteobacteria bacterium]